MSMLGTHINSHREQLQNASMIIWELQKLMEMTLFDNYRGRQTLSRVALMRDMKKHTFRDH